MTTVLQIILILALIALIGIILGYILGKVGCKKVDNSKYVEKNNICEDSYTDNVVANKEELAASNLEVAEDSSGVNIAQSLAATDVAKVAADDKELAKDHILVADNDDSKDAEATDTTEEDALAEKEQQASVNNSADTTEDSVVENRQDVEDSSGATHAQSLTSVSHSDDVKDAISSEKENQASVDDSIDSEATAKENAEDGVVADEQSVSENSDVDTAVPLAASDSDSAEKDNSESSSDSFVEGVKEGESDEDDSGDKPVALQEARGGKADNLCRIKGVGTVIEGKLYNLGVYHFDQIAAWTEKEIKWVDKHLSFSGRIARDNWIEQAKLLAAGEETEFSKRVDKGEVETSRKS